MKLRNEISFSVSSFVRFTSDNYVSKFNKWKKEDVIITIRSLLRISKLHSINVMQLCKKTMKMG